MTVGSILTTMIGHKTKSVGIRHTECVMCSYPRGLNTTPHEFMLTHFMRIAYKRTLNQPRRTKQLYLPNEVPACATHLTTLQARMNLRETTLGRNYAQKTLWKMEDRSPGNSEGGQFSLEQNYFWPQRRFPSFSGWAEKRKWKLPWKSRNGCFNRVAGRMK